MLKTPTTYSLKGFLNHTMEFNRICHFTPSLLAVEWESFVSQWGWVYRRSRWRIKPWAVVELKDQVYKFCTQTPRPKSLLPLSGCVTKTKLLKCSLSFLTHNVNNHNTYRYYDRVQVQTKLKTKQCLAHRKYSARLSCYYYCCCYWKHSFLSPSVAPGWALSVVRTQAENSNGCAWSFCTAVMS